MWLGEVKLADRWIQVANVHLMPLIPGGRNEGAGALAKRFFHSEGVRAKEIAWLHRQLAGDKMTIIAGDFNSPSTLTAPTYLTQRGFTDSFAAVTDRPDTRPTWHWLYNGVQYRYRLDYIFHSAHFETRTSRIIRGPGSDHYLLVSTVQLKGKGEGEGEREGKAATATSQAVKP